jgi:hypothetical protein
VRIDAAVDLDSGTFVAGAIEECADCADLGIRPRNELLPPEAGIDRHDQHEIDVRSNLLERADWR